MILEGNNGHVIETAPFTAYVRPAIDTPALQIDFEQVADFTFPLKTEATHSEPLVVTPEQLSSAEAVLHEAREACVYSYSDAATLKLLVASMDYLDAIKAYLDELSDQLVLSEVADILDELHNQRLQKVVENISPQADDTVHQQYATQSHQITDEKWNALFHTIPEGALYDDEPLEVHEAEIRGCLLDIARDRVKYENAQVELAGELLSDR